MNSLRFTRTLASGHFLGMDIGTHAATGLLLSTAFDDPWAKTLCIAGAIIPDVALFPVYRHIYRQKRDWNIVKHVGDPSLPIPTKKLIPYWTAHSLLPVSALLLLSPLGFTTQILAFCIGYYSHLLWDIPTHTGDFACRPLYPLSTKKVQGFGDWWRSYGGIATVVLTWITLGSGYYFLLP